MSVWKSYHIYYGAIDSLILECVHPFLERARPRLERVFWERHYAGGPHLRVRLRGEPAVVEALGGELARDAERFVRERPTPDLATYSAERAAALMRKEREEPDADALRYRNNTVEEHPYQPPRHVFASDDALALAEDFRHDSMPIAAALLGGERPVPEALLRIFFLQALLVCPGDLPSGCVSCKSHWEGFAASFPSQPMIDRVRETEERNRPATVALMAEVMERYREGTLDGDPVLAAWRDLVEKYRARARRELAEGKQLTGQPKSLEEAREVREKMMSHLQRESGFVSAFWADERFIASLQHDPAWLVPRVATNLLYQFVASAGIGPIDRMALCYYTFRAAEEHSGCDLGDILRGNIDETVEANAARWATA